MISKENKRLSSFFKTISKKANVTSSLIFHKFLDILLQAHVDVKNLLLQCCIACNKEMSNKVIEQVKQTVKQTDG